MSSEAPRTAAVLGASGFVGAAIVEALSQQGWSVRAVKAPRLHLAAEHADGRTLSEAFDTDVKHLALLLMGADVLVNAAGDPNASSGSLTDLLGPNGALPVVALRAASRAGLERFVHVSSSVVQGDAKVLDSTVDTHAFSPYSVSKAAGERWVQAEAANLVQPHVTIYRPPSVHARGRAVTQKIAALARSPFSSVAGKGEAPSPQALLENVGGAVAFLATSTNLPPLIVHHPWEGLSSGDLLRALGGREPHHIPMSVARAAVRAARALERVAPMVAPNRRRMELLWFGQGVAPSWLEDAGWTPPSGPGAWAGLGGGN